MTKAGHSILLSTLVWLWIGSPLAGQESPTVTFDEALEVALIDLDVVVTDRDGEPVRGLVADDFVVRYGGRKIELQQVSEATGEPPTSSGASLVLRTTETTTRPSHDEPAGVAPLRDEATRLNLVLYLDRAHLEPGELDGAIDTLRRFVRSVLRPGDRMMLVEANHDLVIRQPLTGVPELLLSTIDTLKPKVARGRAASEFPQLLTQIEREASTGPDLLARSRNVGPQSLRTQIDNYARRTHLELESTTFQLHRLLPALAGLPGRTALVYVGGTLPTDAAQSLYRAWQRAFGTGSAFQQSRSNTASELDFVGFNIAGDAKNIDTSGLFQAVSDRANAHGVTLHVIDVGGLRRARAFIGSSGTEVTNAQSGGVAPAGRSEIGRRVGNPQTLRIMAESTGGRALINSRNFDAALRAIDRELRTYYTLTFHVPPEAEAESSEVEVDLVRRHRRLRVRHRQAIRPVSPEREAARRAVSALLLDDVANPLAVELSAAPVEPPDGTTGNTAWVPLTVVLPLERLALVPRGNHHRGQLTLYLTSGDLVRGAAQVQHVMVPVEIPNDTLQTALGRKIEYTVRLPIDPAATRVAVTVRDDLQPMLATAVLPLSQVTPFNDDR